MATNYGTIDMRRYVELLNSDDRRAVQDWFKTNTNTKMCYELRAINQQLTVWEADFYTTDAAGRALYDFNEGFATHSEIIETTPAAPHWPTTPNHDERVDHNG